MDSVLRHLWYLAKDTVVFALFDSGAQDEERQEMAENLLQVPYPRNLLRLGKPVMKHDVITGAATSTPGFLCWTSLLQIMDTT